VPNSRAGWPCRYQIRPVRERGGGAAHSCATDECRRRSQCLRLGEDSSRPGSQIDRGVKAVLGLPLRDLGRAGQSVRGAVDAPERTIPNVGAPEGHVRESPSIATDAGWGPSPSRRHRSPHPGDEARRSASTAALTGWIMIRPVRRCEPGARGPAAEMPMEWSLCSRRRLHAGPRDLRSVGRIGNRRDRPVTGRWGELKADRSHGAFGRARIHPRPGVRPAVPSPRDYARRRPRGCSRGSGSRIPARRG
jgi:hypothetical protein